MQENDFIKEHGCYCVTMLNQKGVQEMEYSVQLSEYTENMYFERLSYYEENSIEGNLISEINEKCNVLIGLFEEEDLPNDKLQDVKRVAEKYLKSDISDMQHSAAQKILNVIQKAIECGTYVCFEF